jgi:hypothetical protein
MLSQASHQTADIQFQAGLFQSKAVQRIRELRSQAENKGDSILVAHAENQYINNTRVALTGTPFNDYYFNIWSIVGKDKRELQYNPLVKWLQTVAYWCVYPPTKVVPEFIDLFQTWLTLRGIAPDDYDSAYIEQQRVEFFGHLAKLRIHSMCGSWLDDAFKRLRVEAIQENFKDSVDYKLAVEFLFGQDNSAKSLRNCQVREFARYNSASASNLSLLTIHATKGLQFDHVIVVGILETNNGWSFPRSRDSSAQQRRLVYMILTRARKSIHLISHSANLPPLLERVRHWSQPR